MTFFTGLILGIIIGALGIIAISSVAACLEIQDIEEERRKIRRVK